MTNGLPTVCIPKAGSTPQPPPHRVPMRCLGSAGIVQSLLCLAHFKLYNIGSFSRCHLSLGFFADLDATPCYPQMHEHACLLKPVSIKL